MADSDFAPDPSTYALAGFTLAGGGEGFVVDQAYGLDGFEPARGSHVKQRNPRVNRCRAKNDTCKGWAAKGGDYCYGHMLQFGLVKAEASGVDSE